MTYKLADVFPPRTIEIMLSPEQQETMEIISGYMYEMGLDDATLDEALTMGLNQCLSHFRDTEEKIYL